MNACFVRILEPDQSTPVVGNNPYGKFPFNEPSISKNDLKQYESYYGNLF